MVCNYLIGRFIYSCRVSASTRLGNNKTPKHVLICLKKRTAPQKFCISFAVQLLWLFCIVRTSEGVGVEVVFLDVFEVAVCCQSEFVACGFVGYDHGMWVHLECGDCPHLCDGAFDTVAQGASLVVSVYHEHYFACCHYGAYTYGEGGLGHEVYIAFEEARVCDYGVGSEGFHTCARSERRAGLIEGNVSVGSYAAHEEFDSAVGLDFFLESFAFGLEVFGIAIEDVHVFLGNVDVAEEVVPHERVVAFGMVFGKAHIFVHVESYNIAEAHFAFFVQFDEVTVHSQWRAAGRAAQYEWAFGSGLESVDAGCYVAGSPTGKGGVIGFDYKSH